MKQPHTKTRRVLLFLAILVAGAGSLHAQQAPGRTSARIGYLYPAGTQRGTTCNIEVGGQYLDGIKDLLISGSGIKVSVLEYDRPLQQKRLNELRDYLKDARQKAMQSKERPFDPKSYDVKEVISKVLKEAGATDAEINAFLKDRRQRNDPKRQQNLQIGETVTFQVEVAPDAQTGPREIRAITPRGLSNPLSFCVGRLPEQRKPESLGKTVETAMRVPLPAVLNGQILPGEVDHYAFQARRGSHLLIAVQGRDLIPYLADAVPGWFQPVVALYDAQGQEVAYAYDYRFSPDPVLCYDVPEDGVYLLEIKDALYRGREDFVYRVTVGEVPFVTGISPIGGRLGAECSVDVAGWNLPGTHATVKAQEEGIHRVENLSNGFITGDVAFSSDNLPEVREREPNNTPRSAQRVTLPVIINGRIDAPGDIDVFTFSCNAGDKVVAEVMARRLNSPLDSWLKVTDETGLQVAFNDDMDDKGAGLITHQADSYITFSAPSDGRYYLTIGDSQHKGGPEYAYRLRISAPQPDFALRLVPSSLNGRPGAAFPVTVYALRKDGFADDIKLAFKDAPAGFTLQGGCIPAGQDKVRATVTFPQVIDPKPAPLTLEGRATIKGREKVRPVVPADDMLQAFIYHHLVPASALYAVQGKDWSRGKPPLKPPGPEPVQLVSGSDTQVVFETPGGKPITGDLLQFQLSEPPEGISVAGVEPVPTGIAVTLRASPKVLPGLRGNLLLEVFAERMQPAQGAKKAEKRRFPIGFLPALPFQVGGK